MRLGRVVFLVGWTAVGCCVLLLLRFLVQAVAEGDTHDGGLDGRSVGIANFVFVEQGGMSFVLVIVDLG